MNTQRPKAGAVVAAVSFVAVAALASLDGSAHADESVIQPAAMMPAAAPEEPLSPWMVRGRMLIVSPDESASIPGVGGSVDIKSQVVPEIDFTYFFTKNIAAELIVATTPHDIHHTPTNLHLGTVWLLPPTLTLQYHLMPDNKYIRPYVGAGVNYTIFYGSHDEATGLDVHYDNAWGYALQAGFDIPITKHLGFNLDVKKLFLNTDVKLSGLVNTTADVDIDPWLVGMGLSYRF